ncbi:MAG: PTS sugar transporter subunit IIA [Spirochaetaceae bacterium]|nr:MAG: PTS sugar transporter subunit IIA [Spirochaetaceae bacterium]
MADPQESNFFETGSVVWEIESTDKHDAIREIVFRAPVFRTVANLDLNGFAETVIDRERIQSTGFGHGVAVAHGRTPEVVQSAVALGVSRKGIDYDSFDGRPVHLLFIVANHPEQEMDYLQILSALVTLVRNRTFRQELLACLSCDELQHKLSCAFHELWYQSPRVQQAVSG